jgi:hypothetical protein
MKRIGRTSLLILLGLLVAGCSGTPTETFENQVETMVASTLAAHTPDEPAPVSTKFPTQTVVPPMPEPFGEVYVFTVVQNVNLRTNPGMLFSVSRVLSQDTQLRLLGQAPGGEWLLVGNDEGIEGWVNVNVVSVTDDGAPPPIVEPSGVYLVTGSVFTEAGTPISGIGFAIHQGNRRTDASTNVEGFFYAYLPRTLSGSWRVEHVSVSCTSNTMDVNYNCINNLCGSANPQGVFVELPQINDLAFIWK